MAKSSSRLTLDQLQTIKEAEVAYYKEQLKKPYMDIPLWHVLKKELFDEIMWSFYIQDIVPGSEEEKRQAFLTLKEDIQNTYKESDKDQNEYKILRFRDTGVGETFDPVSLPNFLTSTDIGSFSDDRSLDYFESLDLYAALQKAMAEDKKPSDEFFQALFKFVELHPEYHKNNLLHVACAERWRNVIIFLVEKLKEDVNALNPDGLSPLMIAIKKGYLEIVKYLLQRPKINPNLKIKGDVIALHWCCAQGYDEIVRLLLEKEGLDINLTVVSGYWPMFNSYQANPYTIPLTNREFNIADMILNDKRFKANPINDLLMALVTFFPTYEQQLEHVKRLLVRPVNLSQVINLKEFSTKKNILDLAKFMHLDHTIPFLESKLTR